MVSPIACCFDEFTADIVDNRAFETATRRLLRLPGVRPDTRRNLEHLLVALAEVSDVPLEPAAIDRIVITRLNRHYRPALRLAEVVLPNTSLLDRVGTVEACGFLLDTPMLFQRWVTDRLRRHLAGRLEVVDEPTEYLGVGRRVAMAPDVVFRLRGRDGRTVYVGDVKYKLSSGGARSGDY